jgi:hypothetical protein
VRKVFYQGFHFTTSIVTIFFMILVAGCTAPGPKFSGLEPVSQNLGQVYFYRMSNFVGSANAYEILIDDKKVASLKNAGYLKLDLAPGQHTIIAKPSISTALSIGRPAYEQIVVEPGKRYFFLFSIGSRLGGPTGSATATLYVNSNTLNPVSEDVAIRDMAELGYSE